MRKLVFLLVWLFYAPAPTSAPAPGLGNCLMSPAGRGCCFPAGEISDDHQCYLSCLELGYTWYDYQQHVCCCSFAVK